MTDNTRMVDLPWVDGTTRTVPEGTPYEMPDGYLAFARDGGFSFEVGTGHFFRGHEADSAAVRILTEAPEPPVKANVPTGLGAIVSMAKHPNEPSYVLTRDGWRGLLTCNTYDPSVIAEELSEGARVLFEGVGEDTP